MESRAELAHMRHKKGYNCAQAIGCTYCDLVGVSEEEAFRALEGFGFGMGGMLGTCGAVSGAVYLAGLIHSTVNLESPDSKAKTYGYSKEIVSRFNEMNGAITCKELKGIGTDHGVLRACPGCIDDACALVEEILFSDK